MSRTLNTAKNSIYGISVQIVNYLATFACRTVFIYVLGSTYLGVGGLFSNILSVLSLAELGIGSAMTYNLYKPLANGDEKAISRFMNFYAKAYRIIGISVTALGLALLPFLKFLINDIDAIPEIYLIYTLYIINVGASYFLAYKRTLFEADQKNYIVLIVQAIFGVIMNLAQIVILLVFKNYIAYFSMVIVSGVLTNVTISVLGDRRYRFLKENKDLKLEKEEKKQLTRHVGAMMSHKVGSVVVNGTDNLIISAVLGLSTVGVYSNYYTIINMIKAMLNPIFGSLVASVGNLNASEDTEKSYEVFRTIYLAEHIIQGFVSICFFVLFPPFIKLWIGESYLLSTSAMVVIILNYYLAGMRHPVIIYNTTLGLFWNDRFKPWIEAAVNLITSIVLVKLIGLPGVFLGTLISTVTVCWWLEPYLLFKHHFKMNVFKYYLKYIIDFACVAACAIVISAICEFVPFFVLKLPVCVLLAAAYFGLRFAWTKEFKYGFDRIKSMLVKRKKNGNK